MGIARTTKLEMYKSLVFSNKNNLRLVSRDEREQRQVKNTKERSNTDDILREQPGFEASTKRVTKWNNILHVVVKFYLVTLALVLSDLHRVLSKSVQNFSKSPLGCLRCL